jgi:hypothetical protein
MAAQANDYDCAPGKGYRHPGGDPKPVPFSVGDGLSCLISVGGGLQSPLAFKSGRSTVEISVFSVKNLKDNDTAIRLYTTVANAVAARLAQRQSSFQSRWLVWVNSTVDSIDVSEGLVRCRPKTRTFAGSTAKTAMSSWSPCRNPLSVAS